MVLLQPFSEETAEPPALEPLTSSITVRPARKGDMTAVQEMMALLFPRSRSRILPGDKFLVAERNGLLIGFCHYRLREGFCYIAGLGVLAQYRNHGAGSQLLAEAVYRAEKAGVQTTCLKVRALNTAASLYLRMGFFEKRSGDTLLLVRKRQN